jgi:hypothetical protein
MGLKDPMQIDLDLLMEVITIPHPIYNMMAGSIKMSENCASVAQILATGGVPDMFTLSLLDQGAARLGI